jgi:ABC-type lipoprotein release transport system permease subunit
VNTRWVWWRIAWRNLWRNRRRTLITASALAFGYLASVTMIGIWYGVVAEMLENGTNLYAGQIQVHAEGFLPERSMYSTLGGKDGVDVDALLTELEAADGVVAAAPRVFGGGLVSSGDETVAGILVGIDPVREAKVTRLLSYLVEGRAPEPGMREIVIGTKMAETLGAGVGSEVVLVAPASDGSLGNDLFTVIGLLRTGTPAFDGAYTFMDRTDLQDLLWLDRNRIHEVVATVSDAWAAPEISQVAADHLSSRFGAALSVRPWTVYRAELAEYARLAFAANGVIVGIVFGMAIFGVANTLLMSTFERRREFAVLRALGTEPGHIGRTVVYEGLILGILSLVGGALLTVPVLYRLHEFPIDLSGISGGFSMAGAMVRPVLRAEYTWDGPIVSALALMLTTLVASLFPAFRAVRIPPADVLSD